ncbi:MAG: CRISPR-associated helicase/endonuclease Cas3 [Roseiflexaceae bacterium]
MHPGDEHTIKLFWGKTPKSGEDVTNYHPALFHMLDVALAAKVLLRDGPPRLRQALMHAFEGCDPQLLLDWLPFLVATHDLGKISAAFQGQNEAQRARLQALQINFRGQADLYHAQISACWLHMHLESHEPGIARRLMWVLRDAMGGHHGRFMHERMTEVTGRLLTSERAESRWPLWRTTTYTLLRGALAPDSKGLAALGEPRHLSVATVALTGFIVWCDWIGSNEHDFPATPLATIAEYLPRCYQRAQQALDRHALRAVRPPPYYRGYQASFGNQPRPLQSHMEQIDSTLLQQPLLAVIEAPTGEGKTEAALVLARQIAAQRGIDELFVGLPTMATSNQMFQRLEQFYQREYGSAGAVRLTHGQSPAVEEDLRHAVLQARLASNGDALEREHASAQAAVEWFVGSKKAMLAPFGVGTVDQIELAGLNVKHYPLRLFGLAGKVVIIDEIHAYDTYMSTILAHTLTWLASLGCSVILLSATLPIARHEALARAFIAGLDTSHEPPTLSPDHPYPSIALYHAHGHHQQSCAVFRGEQRMTLRLVEQRDHATEARYLIDLVRDGGAVARLCNRVDDAQALFQALQEVQAQIPLDTQIILHARFPLQQRQQYERQVEAWLGKTTQRTPSQRIIIVGTQVLEQSLDYDVDVMISDFAPMDLLLQRAGRLHRHARTDANGRPERPPRHQEPVLEVSLPVDINRLPDWKRWAPIYEPYILWRTWEVLRTHTTNAACTIVLPRDYRPLIERVYQDGVVSPDQPYTDQVAQAWHQYQHQRAGDEAKARSPLIPAARGTHAIIEAGVRDYIDEESRAANAQLAKTRLGDRIMLVPVWYRDGRIMLDRHGSWSISSDIPPDPELQASILRHALPVSDRRVIQAYRHEQRDRSLKWPWNDVPALLRSLYPLPLDDQQTAIINGCHIRLDALLGLVLTNTAAAQRFTAEEEL